MRRVENSFLKSKHDIIKDFVNSPRMIKVMSRVVIQSVCIQTCGSQYRIDIFKTFNDVLIIESIVCSFLVLLGNLSSRIIHLHTSKSCLISLQILKLLPLFIHKSKRVHFINESLYLQHFFNTFWTDRACNLLWLSQTNFSFFLNYIFQLSYCCKSSTVMYSSSKFKHH